MTYVSMISAHSLEISDYELGLFIPQSGFYGVTTGELNVPVPADPQMSLFLFSQ